MKGVFRLGVLILAAVGVYLFASAAPDGLNEPGKIASAVFLGVLLVWVLRSPELYETSFGVAMRNGALWAGILAALVIGYEYRGELRHAALRVSSALQPGQPIVISQDVAILTRAGDGHFVTMATVNGAPLRMMVDTGATDIALPYEEAERLGINVDALAFIQPVITANGSAMVAPVRLDEVRIGDIALRNVSASVSEPNALGSALLGMSFLGRLSEFSFRGDRLELKR
ncbi:MAG: TIGR02281 family clan AA aspartic protease [Pseudomonadota bacterium]